MSRKPIQLTATDKQIYALCDDGSMWRISERLMLDTTFQKIDWERLPYIPHRANIYLAIGVDEIDKPFPDFLESWDVDVDAMGDEMRYLICSKHSKQFSKQDLDVLEQYGKPPKGWPNNLL